MAYTLLDDEPKGYRLLEDEAPKADPKLGQPEELAWYEKFAAGAPDWMAGANFRGQIPSRIARGIAKPVVAAAQIYANASPLARFVGQDRAVNEGMQQREAEYQAARADAGSSGFDVPETIGSIVSTAPIAAGGQTGGPAGAIMGGIAGALEPVTDGGEDFWWSKGKQTGVGAASGFTMAKLLGAFARTVSPKASVNPDLNLLRNEGAQPSIGQTLGGWANAVEEKAQSLPILGSAIRAARQRGGKQLESAAFARAAGPIGEKIAGRGHEGIAELSGKLGASYERVLPKVAVNVLDDSFVQKMSRLRSMVPQQERGTFDDVIAREIDGRVAPNGVLSGQNLKDAWIALRNEGKTFSRSPDGYQQKLGQAFKQALQELKDHIDDTATDKVAVAALKNTDLGYANFKRLQKAAGSLGAEGGSFSPAQLHSAVKAADWSNDKGKFSAGKSLMQDLSGAGKRVLSNKVPDSGTAGRAMLGGLGVGAIFEPVTALTTAGGLGAGAVAYAPPVQNALRALIVNRPEAAPVVANYLRQLQAAGVVLTVPMLEQAFDR